MKKLLIKENSVVLITGRGNHNSQVTLPFYLAQVSFVEEAAIFVIDLRISPTRALRMDLESDLLIHHISGTYQATNAYRSSHQGYIFVPAEKLNSEPLTPAEIIVANIQLSDTSDILLTPATITGIDPRSGNKTSRNMMCKLLELPEGCIFERAIILDQTRRYFSNTHFDISNCSVKTGLTEYDGAHHGFTICTGRKQFPIILASAKNGGANE